MTRTKEFAYAALSKVIGFIIFLVLLAAVNILAPYINNQLFSSVVSFLNSNIWLIIAFVVVLLIGELFGYLFFPLNIPSPLFNAVGAVLLVQFIFNIISFVISLSGVSIPLPMNTIEIITIIIVFVAVLVVGYIDIIRDATKPRKKPVHSEMHEKPIKEKRHVVKRHS